MSQSLSNPPANCQKQTCWPMFIYLLFVLPGAIAAFFVPATKNASKQSQISGAVAGAIWVALWAFIMWELCRHCHRGWAWFLLLLPIIVGIALAITVAVIIEVEKKKNQNNK